MTAAQLGPLTEELLAAADLEPAEWLDDSEDLGKLVPLAKVGIEAAPELVEYMKLAEDVSFRQRVGAILHHRQESFYWGLGPVRSPSSLLFRHTSSEVVAFLMGTSVIASDPDSGAYLTAAWSTSAVSSFLFNDVAPSDPTPGDFVVEALSIREFLTVYGDPERRPDETEATCRELARLYRRGIWLAQLVQEDELDSLDEIARAARDASPPALYAKERDSFATHPHHAAYWLLSHAFHGHSDDLDDALARTEKIKHPAIADLRKKLPRLEKLLAKARPDWKIEDVRKAIS